MADPQFEQFREVFEKLPQHIKAPQHCYRLTHDISPDSSPSDENLDEEDKSDSTPSTIIVNGTFSDKNCNISNNKNNQDLDEDTGRWTDDTCNREIILNPRNNLIRLPPAPPPPPMQNGERKRRKLPPIPVDTQTTSASVVFTTRAPSLAEELREAEEASTDISTSERVYFPPRHAALSMVLELSDAQHTNISHINFDSLPEEDSSPEGKVPSDSGNSTAHSPDGAKCFSPIVRGCRSPSSPASSSGVSSSTLELLEATHRGLHRFMPRHGDEIEIDIGDPVYIQKEADDLWCEGVNLRTGKRGIFPGAYVTDVDYTDFDPEGVQVKKERYLLHFLGSLEVNQHKGNAVLCQAVLKIVRSRHPAPHPPHPCILEVSDQGLRMVDKSKPPPNHVPCHDYFFNLKNVTFCGYHPRDHRYFGFITKHPTQDRLACHIFTGEESTRSVAEAVGRAFQRFYHKYIETAYPIEDIYIDTDLWSRPEKPQVEFSV